MNKFERRALHDAMRPERDKFIQYLTGHERLSRLHYTFVAKALSNNDSLWIVVDDAISGHRTIVHEKLRYEGIGFTSTSTTEDEYPKDKSCPYSLLQYAPDGHSDSGRDFRAAIIERERRRHMIESFLNWAKTSKQPFSFPSTYTVPSGPVTFHERRPGIVIVQQQNDGRLIRVRLSAFSMVAAVAGKYNGFIDL